jgi:hypothetical protein
MGNLEINDNRESLFRKGTMMSKKRVLMGLGLLLVLSILAAQSFSQEGGPEGRGRRGGGPGGGQPGGPQMAAPGGERPGQMAQRDPEQMRQMMRERQIQRIKQALKATDEQWAKIETPLKKVLDLSQQASGMGFGGRAMAGRGQRQGAPEGQEPPAAAEPETKLEKARLELRTAIDAGDQKEIEAKLAAFRTAKEEAKKELEAAQKDLKKQLTPPQEAELVLMGYLD